LKITSAPACAKSLTAAAPIPREPPVISAALPASEIIQSPTRFKKQNRTAEASRFLNNRAPRRGHEIAKQSFRKSIAKHTLCVPLNTDHPVCVARPLHTLNNPVGRVGRNTQILPRLPDGLVVRTVNLCPLAPCQFSQPALRLELRPVNRIILRFRGKVPRPVRSLSPEF